MRSVALVLATSQSIAFSAENPSVEERLKALETQNAILREQVTEQQKTIEGLQQKISPSPEQSGPLNDPPKSGFNWGGIHIGGEGGAGYFHSQSDGDFPEGAFRVDEAKLFVEAPIWTDTYFFGELNLIIRESAD